jgi:hypothetical protein
VTADNDNLYYSECQKHWQKDRISPFVVLTRFVDLVLEYLGIQWPEARLHTPEHVRRACKHVARRIKVAAIDEACDEAQLDRCWKERIHMRMDRLLKTYDPERVGHNKHKSSLAQFILGAVDNMRLEDERESRSKGPGRHVKEVPLTDTVLRSAEDHREPIRQEMDVGDIDFGVVEDLLDDLHALKEPLDRVQELREDPTLAEIWLMAVFDCDRFRDSLIDDIVDARSRALSDLAALGLAGWVRTPHIDYGPIAARHGVNNHTARKRWSRFTEKVHTRAEELLAIFRTPGGK